jgi:hypothetical protein
MKHHRYPPQRMACALLIAQAVGSSLGASTVLWIMGYWSFSLAFLLKGALLMSCAMLLLVGAMWTSFRRCPADLPATTPGRCARCGWKLCASCGKCFMCGECRGNA